jgi:hypothetical protein
VKFSRDFTYNKRVTVILVNSLGKHSNDVLTPKITVEIFLGITKSCNLSIELNSKLKSSSALIIATNVL